MARFVLVLPLLMALAVGLSGGEDAKKKGADKPRTAGEAGKKDKQPRLFDADEFIQDHDSNKDGVLSKDELPERFRHNFEKLDANKDGKISKEELEKGFHHLQARRRPSDFVFVLVEMSDCDECCAEELQVVYDFLRKLDKDGNGKIAADELKAGREELVNKRVDAVFKALDTNKDGKISKEEARGQVRRHFDELDTNKDGFVSRDELLKAGTALPGKSAPEPKKEK